MSHHGREEMNQNTFCKNCHRIPSQCCCTISTEMECNPHPNAPHGFLRQASHDAGRYVCECEWWSQKDYELSTHEKAEEFAKKRNYEWDQWKPIE